MTTSGEKSGDGSGVDGDSPTSTDALDAKLKGGGVVKSGSKGAEPDGAVRALQSPELRDLVNLLDDRLECEKHDGGERGVGQASQRWREKQKYQHDDPYLK